MESLKIEIIDKKQTIKISITERDQVLPPSKRNFSRIGSLTGDIGDAGEVDCGEGDLSLLLETTVELAPGMKGVGGATARSLVEGSESIISEVISLVISEVYINSVMLLVVGTTTVASADVEDDAALKERSDKYSTLRIKKNNFVLQYSYSMYLSTPLSSPIKLVQYLYERKIPLLT